MLKNIKNSLKKPKFRQIYMKYDVFQTNKIFFLKKIQKYQLTKKN